MLTRSFTPVLKRSSGSFSKQGLVCETHAGLAVWFIRGLFKALSDADRVFSVKCNALEIYCETITDLLSTEQHPLNLREDFSKGGSVFVQGLTDSVAYQSSDAEALLLRAMKKRVSSSTPGNFKSSRSHCVFTVELEQRVENRVLRSRVSFVDLAGSEPLTMSLKETGAINRSLSSLTLVVSALSSGAKFVSYRDSKLTFLLKDCLGGNSETTIIGTLFPCSKQHDRITSCTSACLGVAGMNTLGFAQRCAGLKCRAVINEEVLGGEVEDLKRELKTLKAQLGKFISGSSCGSSGTSTACTSPVVNASSRETRLQMLLAGAIRSEAEAQRKADELGAAAQHLQQQVSMLERYVESTKGIEKISTLLTGISRTSGHLEEIRLLRSMLENHPERVHRIRLEREVEELKADFDRRSDARQISSRQLDTGSRLIRNKSSTNLLLGNRPKKPALSRVSSRRLLHEDEAVFLPEEEEVVFSSTNPEEENLMLKKELKIAREQIAEFIRNSASN